MRQALGEPPGTFPTGIAADEKGNIWFTEEIGNVIGRIRTGSSDPCSIPTEQTLPWDITLGPNDAMWFTELAGRNISRIGAKGKIKEFPVPAE
ncbi:MAG: virginiamycin B lyase family protein [Geodermatophilaceae bacterium]